MGELKTLILVAIVVVFAVAILHIRDGRKIKRLHDGRAKPPVNGRDALNEGGPR